MSCRPNPFNPRTEIRFELRRSGTVTVDVLDTRGRSVRTLRHGPAEAGVQRVIWDGTDARHRHVASGVYLIRVEADGLEGFQRVTLIE